MIFKAYVLISSGERDVLMVAILLCLQADINNDIILAILKETPDSMEAILQYQLLVHHETFKTKPGPRDALADPNKMR